MFGVMIYLPQHKSREKKLAASDQRHRRRRLPAPSAYSALIARCAASPAASQAETQVLTPGRRTELEPQADDCRPLVKVTEGTSASCRFLDAGATAPAAAGGSANWRSAPSGCSTTRAQHAAPDAQMLKLERRRDLVRREEDALDMADVGNTGTSVVGFIELLPTCLPPHIVHNSSAGQPAHLFFQMPVEPSPCSAQKQGTVQHSERTRQTCMLLSLAYLWCIPQHMPAFESPAAFQRRIKGRCFLLPDRAAVPARALRADDQGRVDAAPAQARHACAGRRGRCAAGGATRGAATGPLCASAAARRRRHKRRSRRGRAAAGAAAAHPPRQGRVFIVAPVRQPAAIVELSSS